MDRTIDDAAYEIEDDSEEDTVTCYIQDDSYDKDELKMTEEEKTETEFPSEEKDCNDGDGHDVVPSVMLTAASPVKKKIILEDNLLRLHVLHEGIQKLRELNSRQTLSDVSQHALMKRLSTSCPSLLEDEIEIEYPYTDVIIEQEKIHGSMFNISSDNSLPTELGENCAAIPKVGSFLAVDSRVKIHINDLTPTGSQECLTGRASTTLSNVMRHHGNNADSISNRQSVVQPHLLKLDPEDAVLPFQRRRSWSSTDQDDDEKSKIKKTLVKSQRSMSLSSLDSEADETFFDARDEIIDKADKIVSVASTDGRWEKQRSLSGSSSPLHMIMASTDCASFHSLNDYGIQDKQERKGCEKINYGSSSNLTTPRLATTLQKSVSTPSIIAVKDTAAESPYPNVLLSQHGYIVSHHETDQDPVLNKRKKRGGSIFSRKKRGKDKEKDFRKSSHQFVPVCYSNSAVCDVCNKSMANKPALHCETCLVNVHEHSCKDQILDCSRFKIFQKGAQKHAAVYSNSPHINISRHSSQASGPLVVVSGTSNTVSPPLSTKDKKANSSGQLKHTQHGSSTMLFKTSPSSSTSSGRAYVPSGYSQWRRVATKLGVNKVINEEKESDGQDENVVPTNMTELNSTSMESLDEDAGCTTVDAVDFNDIDDDPELGLLDDEPEAWSSTAEKKMLKKMKDKDIKRQENIYELLITEKHHCLTLKIMQKVFAQGMLKELQISFEMVEKVFPQLDELIELHTSFLRKLRERQRKSVIIDSIGDIILQQFQGKTGDHMKSVYGEFCSRHKDAVSLYKDILKSDRKFQSFIKRISANPVCKTRGIPECILLVTQRLTKYPLLIEAMLKSLKESNKMEQINLVEANTLVKEILNCVNGQVADKEKEQRLLEMYNKIDAKSATAYRGKKFKKSDLLSNNRKLRFEGPIHLNQARGKVLEVTAVVLSDVIFFLQENNQKYTFVTQDNKAGVISLQKLLVREKAGSSSTGIYLISSNPSDPEMYELVCPSRKDKKKWIDAIHAAVEICPEDEDIVPSEGEEERKIYEVRNARVRQLEAGLQERDHKLAAICEEKMKIFIEMMDIACKEEISDNFKYTHLIDEMQEGPETRELLLTALQEATRLASSLYAEGTNLSRSVSSAGEHQSEAYISPILPKRAETFGGFDYPNKDTAIVIPKPSGMKKKLHLLKDHDGRAASLLNLAVKTERESSPVDGSDPFLHVKQIKEVRRASGPLPSRDIPNCPSPDQLISLSRRSTFSSTHFLAPDQQENTPLQINLLESQPKDTVGELLTFSSTPPLLTLGKEKWAAAIQMSHYLNTLMCLFSQHFTNVESLRSQLTMANEQIAKLEKEAGRDRDKRHLYRHNQQLEELRNLQEQLSQERTDWQKKYESQNEELEKQRQDLQKQQEQLKQDQNDIANQRDFLYRYLEALQRHGITISPNMSVVGSVASDESSQPVTVPTNPQNESPTSHRRNVSCDVQPQTKEVNSMHRGTSSSPTHTLETKKGKGENVSGKGRTNSSGNISLNLGKRDSFPLNLCSATNQQKASQSLPVRQQLPLKLASKENASNLSTKHGCETAVAGSSKQLSSGSMQQLRGSTVTPPTQAVNASFLTRSDKRLLSSAQGNNESKPSRTKDSESNQEIFFF